MEIGSSFSSKSGIGVLAPRSAPYQEAIQESGLSDTLPLSQRTFRCHCSCCRRSEGEEVQDFPSHGHLWIKPQSYSTLVLGTQEIRPQPSLSLSSCSWCHLEEVAQTQTKSQGTVGISPRFQAYTVSPESPNPAPNPRRHGEYQIIVCFREHSCQREAPSKQTCLGPGLTHCRTMDTGSLLLMALANTSLVLFCFVKMNSSIFQSNPLVQELLRPVRFISQVVKQQRVVRQPAILHYRRKHMLFCRFYRWTQTPEAFQ